MDSDNELEEPGHQIQKPSDFFNKIVFLQADLIYNAFAFLISPASTLLSLISESFQHAEEAKYTVESAVRKYPSAVAHRVRVAVRRLSYGVVAVASMCMVMVLLLVVAAAVSGLAIRFWIEEPVELREKLNFDYTLGGPRALFGMENGSAMKMKKKMNLGIPVGHSFFVRVVLLMPESPFNRELGVFQLSAELISTNGNIIARSSQPCMLRFRSTPVRFAQTFLTSLPLLLGISTETQKLTFPILNHKEENHQRSAAIQVTISPRMGTSALPELYEAHILINSKLPKMKELLRRWRWTCFLWTSLYLYLLFLVIFMFFCKPVVFRAMTLAELSGFDKGAPTRKEAEESFDEMAEITVELLRKWQEMRRKRKAAMFRYEEVGRGGDVGSIQTSASSISCSSREYIAAVFEEDVEDSDSESESVLLEGSEYWDGGW
ncbi:seipin-1 isoform X2 [Benincasa hispida]|uniref:seipin-1 isoform X2 n=1 Tax=Benincasa hispida TaxID=102211 RepID=UPI001900E286|nr:seipin-1 isoform X2 [Benincasa hispida]